MAIKSKKKLISIVIKNEEIKICELSKQGKTVKVFKAVEISTPEGTVDDGIIEKGRELAAAIRETLDKNHILSKEVVFSIYSGKIATKEEVIPEVRDNKIVEIINANASEYFPVNIDQYIIKHTILERFQEENEKKIKLQVVAAPIGLVEAYYDLAKELGLSVVDIDYAGNSLDQILKYQISDKFSVVINIEVGNTIVNIFENNSLKLQRNIPYGKGLIVGSVMEKYGIDSEDEAMEKLRNEDLFSDIKADSSLEDGIRYIINSVKRITDYYITRNGNRPFEEAYIIGNITTIKGMVNYLSEQLQLNLISLNTVQNIVVENNDEAIMRGITSYLVNIGAMINPIGLIAQTEGEDAVKKDSLRPLVILLIGSVAISAALIAMPLIDIIFSKSELSRIEDHIDKLSYIEKTVDEYYKSKDMLTDASAFAGISENNNDSLHIFIDKLEESIPSDVAFTSMSVASGAVNISGTATSKSSLAKLIQQLQAIDTVGNVNISSESEAEDNTGVITVTFSLTCTFGRGME